MSKPANTSKQRGIRQLRNSFAIAATIAALFAGSAIGAPKVILISLDGATPRLMQQYISNNAILPNTGIRLLESKGVRAAQNLTINPSLYGGSAHRDRDGLECGSE